MPELPETETIARDLRAKVVGLSVTSAEITRPDVLRGIAPHVLETRLLGLRITGVRRRAKSVLIEFESATMVVTPRFTGVLHLRQDTDSDPYDALRLGLGDHHLLAYRDVRRLGTIQLFSTDELSRFDRSLGPEPLGEDFTKEVLSGILRSSGSPIKKTLMTPQRLAGVGNIYANEVLWAAGVDPSRSAKSLGEREVAALHRSLQHILDEAIRARGTTFRDYRDANNERGGYASSLRAYGRGGTPCERCGTRLAETHAIDGRSTVFCFRCQC